MTPKQKETLEIIKKRLNEDNKFNVKDIKNRKSAFTLEIKPKKQPKVLPITVASPKQPNDEIMIFWVWGFAPVDIRTLKNINLKAKQKFELDLNMRFQIMDLQLRFYTSINNFKGLYIEKHIKLDELSKTVLLDIIAKLGKALNLTGKKFIEHFSIPPKFDRSSHV